MILEKIVQGVSGVGFALFGVRMIDVNAIPEVTPNIGNFPYAFLPVYFSGFVGEDMQASKNKYVRDLGKCLPGLSCIATTAYLSLGEIYPIVPNNHLDESDIPAVFFGTICGYLLAKIHQIKERNKRYSRLKAKVLNKRLN